MQQARSIEHRNIFESKTNAILNPGLLCDRQMQQVKINRAQKLILMQNKSYLNPGLLCDRQMQQARSIEHRNVFESKTNAV